MKVNAPLDMCLNPIRNILLEELAVDLPYKRARIYYSLALVRQQE